MLFVLGERNIVDIVDVLVQLGEDEAVVLEANTDLADILIKANIFSSRKEVKKNNWLRPIDKGFTQLVIGKKKKLVRILN